MILASLALAAFMLLGHLALFVYVVNRMHSFAWPRPLVKLLDCIWSAFGVGVPLATGIWALSATISQQQIVPPGNLGKVCLVYLAICVVCAVGAIFHRIKFVFEQKPTPFLESNHTTIINMVHQLDESPAATRLTAALGWLPGNEIYQLSVHTKQLAVPTLPKQLDGLTITHLSDLHMTGQLTRGFYEEVVRQSNQLNSDIVAITGDIVERRMCLDWIAPTLGQLSAPYGVYYVVGNHELRVRDIELVRNTLDAAGLIGLGGRWLKIEPRGYPLVLAGNELPWFKPAADLRDCPQSFGGYQPFRILLSHSPDQLRWAREREFNLQLAGHTHGGQVRLPLVGPILAPSKNGVKHAAGTFYDAPTLLHVSRGIAGTRPLRLNCKPELARLVLKASRFNCVADFDGEPAA